MEIQLYQDLYQSYITSNTLPQDIKINKILFPSLIQFMMEDVKITESKIIV